MAGARVDGFGSGRRALVLVALTFGVVTALTAIVAHPGMFTGFEPKDDEGYMLVMLKSFLNGGGLYEDVYGQYGPFYYEAWGGVFTILNIPITHDAGRALTLVVWVSASLAIGVAVLRMTGSILIGVAAQMLAFAALQSLTDEPMHPGGMVCLLLAAIVAISTAFRDRASLRAAAGLGIALAALALVKINIGVFALAALALAAVVTYPALSGRHWLRLLVEVGFIATPAALMAAELDGELVRDYTVHVTISALAIVIALRARESHRRENEELWWLAGGFLAGAMAILGAAVGSGTSFAGLFDGIIGEPLGQADAFSLPLLLEDRVLTLDALALAGALGYLYLARLRRLRDAALAGPVTAILSILVGIEMALVAIGEPLFFRAETEPFATELGLLAFAWVALIPVPGAPAATSFARLLLPPLAVLQALHAYPVAGSQILWSSLLLVPVGMLCVAAGVRGLSMVLASAPRRWATVPLAAAAVLVATVHVADATLGKQLREARDLRSGSVSLDLPGAAAIQLSPGEAGLYRNISTAIVANCTAFVMLPGMDSFYLWSGQTPPTGYTATAWTALFDDADQRRVIEDTRSIDGLCLLENRPLALGWEDGPIQQGPLVRWLGRGFEPVAAFGDYRLLRRGAESGAAS